MSSIHSLAAALVAVAACGGGQSSHDRSVTDHEREARAHESEARAIEQRCAERRRNELTAPVGSEPNVVRLDRPGEPCWKAADKRFVDAHRDAATKHRAASAVLRDAEARACAGISLADREISPLERAGDIARVEPYVQKTTTPRPTFERELGAVVTFRAVPGLTAEWLQREVDCHLARNAALGHDVPEMPNCPLVPRSVTVRVRSVGDGFAVEIRSDDPDTAHEILTRAQRVAAAEMSLRQ